MNYQLTKRVLNASSIASLSVTNEKKHTTQLTSFAAVPAPLRSETSESGEAYASSVDNLIYVFAPNGGNDGLQYFNDSSYDPTSTDFNYMTIVIEGVPVAVICYTVEREGTSFVYTRNNKFYRGVFTNGEINF